MHTSFVRNENKVMVIGLDGATWTLLKPFAEQGIMPNLFALMDKGSYGKLISTIPPITAPAFASFMTGKWPGKHGLFGFYKWDSARGKFHICSSRDIKGPKFWNILNYYQKTVGVYNLELTYPVEKVNGFIIPIPPSEDNNFETYPPGIISELIKECGDYRARINTRLKGLEIAREVLHMTKNRIKTMLYLYRKYTPDFMFTLFKAPDILQHRYWGYLDPQSEIYNSSSAYKLRPLLLQSYQEIDRAIGLLLNEMRPETHLFLMSDHGFGLLKYRVNVNRFLDDNDFLHCDKLKMFLLILLNQIGIGPKNMMNIPAFMGGGRMQYILSKSINWGRTIAYSSTSSETGIFLNRGIISEDRIQQVAGQIRKMLIQIKNPYTNRPVFREIYLKGDLYGGHLDWAPDLILDLHEGYTISERIVSIDLFKKIPYVQKVKNESSGYHEINGIYLGYGRDIKNQGECIDINIVDLLPTILYLMGLPVPDDLDGKIVKELFTPSFLDKNALCYSKALEFEDKEAVFEYSEDEQKEIIKHLSNLGYL